MRTALFAFALLAGAPAAHAQSSLLDGRDGRQFGQDLYQYRGDREGIMQEFGRGGGMSFGMGGGVIPGYEDPPASEAFSIPSHQDDPNHPDPHRDPYAGGYDE